MFVQHLIGKKVIFAFAEYCVFIVVLLLAVHLQLKQHIDPPSPSPPLMNKSDFSQLTSLMLSSNFMCALCGIIKHK